MRNKWIDLWSLIRAGRPSIVMLAVSIFSALISVAGTLWFPLQTQRIIDGLGLGNNISTEIILLIVTLVGASVFSAISAFFLAKVGHRIVAELRCVLTLKMLKLPIASFDKVGSGERISRVVRDCESISELTTNQAVNLVTGLLLLSGSIVVLVLLDVRLTITLLGSIIAAFTVMIPVSFLLDGLSRKVQDRAARLSDLLNHIFSEIRLVKAFTAETRESQRCQREIEDLRRLGMRVSTINVALEPIISLAMTVAIIVILISGASRVARGEITIGTLTAFILYIFNVATPLAQLTNFSAELQTAKGASSRIQEILAEVEEFTPVSSPVNLSGQILEFRNVAFSYVTDQRAVLVDINMCFKPGTTTALVGVSGSGKTTILSLIERFYLPTKGEILYGNISISEFPLQLWRGKIGYVAQNAPIMPGSVRDNITYGLDIEFTNQQVISAAERAGALDFIERMPHGFETLLIEQGNNLSGGQRQRIAIARMFLRDPDILILDEATSNLDSETEYQVKSALDALMRDRTNIIVAHRLSTIMDADQIYFLDSGRISGVGTHHELLTSHIYYARLVERQFQKRKEPAFTEPIS
ncbi:ABC transporter ATP-binding protein [Microbulbifer epialgicus]|uniref:ABC transporter ATP-binding protein n=1 Tax=Microbulbifer epialgicus TaxID=393907 RepID=A0ABV4P2J3_9GAMM